MFEFHADIICDGKVEFFDMIIILSIIPPMIRLKYFLLQLVMVAFREVKYILLLPILMVKFGWVLMKELLCSIHQRISDS